MPYVHIIILSIAMIATVGLFKDLDARDAHMREVHSCVHYLAYEEGVASDVTDRQLWEMYAARCNA